jgi:hypothetical protein
MTLRSNLVILAVVVIGILYFSGVFSVFLEGSTILGKQKLSPYQFSTEYRTFCEGEAHSQDKIMYDRGWLCRGFDWDSNADLDISNVPAQYRDDKATWGCGDLDCSLRFGALLFNGKGFEPTSWVLCVDSYCWDETDSKLQLHESSGISINPQYNIPEGYWTGEASIEVQLVYDYDNPNCERVSNEALVCEPSGVVTTSTQTTTLTTTTALPSPIPAPDVSPLIVLMFAIVGVGGYILVTKV